MTINEARCWNAGRLTAPSKSEYMDLACSRLDPKVSFVPALRTHEPATKIEDGEAILPVSPFASP